MDPAQTFLFVSIGLIVFALGCIAVARVNRQRSTACLPDPAAFLKMMRESQKPVEVANKYYEMARGHVTHEDSLVNQRMTWNIVVQLGLSAAMFQTYRQGPVGESLVDVLPNIRNTIVILGTIFCLVSAFGVLAAHVSVSRVKSMWIGLADIIRRDYPGYASFQLSGEGLPGWIGFACHYALIIMILASWLIFYAQGS
jgi:hypothetical protein